MRPLLKRALLVVLVFAVTWAGAIWYWRENDSTPDSHALLVYLLLLPLIILALIWVGRFLAGALLGAPALAVTAAAAPAAPAPPPSAPPLPPLGVLASALRVPFGASAAALSDVLAAQGVRAALDPELVDDEGFPVMSARVADADDPAAREDMQAWLGANGYPALQYNDEQWRALVLAAAALTELAGHAALHRGLSAGAAPGSAPPPLQLLLLWQAGWQADQRSAAASWLRELVAREGWPREGVALDPELAGSAAGATPAALLQRLARQSAAGHPVLAIALAFGSHIGEASVGHWAAGNELLTAKQAQGKVPGEGAAGLLLADPVQAALIARAEPVQVSALESRREASADGAPRTDARVLQSLATQVLQQGSAAPAEVRMIVADTGSRTSRVLEAMSVAGSVLPELDGDDELLQVGRASGTCGAVPFLAALAVAVHQAAKLNAPVLCLSNEDPFRRCAALVRPATVLS